MKSFLLAFVLLLSACASQQSLTGGPKDETPPKLLKALPNDQSVNYRGQLIRLEFDEYIEANDLKKELLIAPITKVRYNHLVKKNVLEITFDSALDANTTYSFNFRAAVGDFNERNKVKDLRLAFSTGNNIDTLSASGTVLYPLTGKPVEKAAAILFPYTDSLRLEKGKPMYMATTDKDGKFQITNIRPGKYWLDAIEEKDGDLKYTKREERIGVYPQPIEIADTLLQGLGIEVMEYDYQPFKYLKGKKSKQYFEMSFSKPIKRFELQMPDAMQGVVLAKAQKEMIRLYGNAQLDSFQMAVAAFDSADVRIDTTVWVGFENPKKPAKDAFVVEQKILPENASIKDSVKFELVFNKPVAIFVPDSAKVLIGKDTLALKAVPALGKYRTSAQFSLPPAYPSTILFSKGAFISVENDTLEAIEVSVKPLDEETLGVLIGSIETWASSFILQVLDDKGAVERQVQNVKKFRFERLKPGAKQLRILIDKNQNNRWESGDYRTRVQPEPVFFYKGEINIKSNWEIELTPWILE